MRNNLTGKKQATVSVLRSTIDMEASLNLRFAKTAIPQSASRSRWQKESLLWFVLGFGNYVNKTLYQ